MKKKLDYGYLRIMYGQEEKKESFGFIISVVIFAIIATLVYMGVARASEIDYSNDQIANAIYHAEGGAKTNHPYGILAHYKTTSSRQACINTIKHARRDFVEGDFIAFLGNRYCPVGASNDPRGLNKNWVRNVKRLLARAA